jgi:hypothetical protein
MPVTEKGTVEDFEKSALELEGILFNVLLKSTNDRVGNNEEFFQAS